MKFQCKFHLKFRNFTLRALHRFFFIRFAKKVFVFGKVFVSKMYSLKKTNNPKRIHISKRIVFKRILFTMPCTKTASNIRIFRKRILTFRIHFWNYRKTNTLRSITLKFSSRKRILWKLKKRIKKNLWCQCSWDDFLCPLEWKKAIKTYKMYGHTRASNILSG